MNGGGVVFAVIKCLCVQLEEGKMMERRKKIALELSDLVIYCRPVPFDEDSRGRSHTHTHTLSRGY